MSAWIETSCSQVWDVTAQRRTLMSAWIETMRESARLKLPESHSHECVD